MDGTAGLPDPHDGRHGPRQELYALPTWTPTVALVAEPAALRSALGCTDRAEVPSVHACYRFAAKLRAHKPLLDACLDRVTAAPA